MKRLLLVTGILMLFLSSGIAQGDGLSFQQETQRLNLLINNSKPDTGRVHLFVQLGYEYLKAYDKKPATLDVAVSCANKALQLANQLKYKTGMADSYLLLAKTAWKRNNDTTGNALADKATALYAEEKAFSKQGEAFVDIWSRYSELQKPLPERSAWLQKGANAFNVANNKLREGDCYKEMGDYYQLGDSLALSLSSLKLAIACYKAAPHANLYSVYGLTAIVYNKLGDLNESLRYGLMALDGIEAAGDTSLQLCTIYNRLASSYDLLKDYKNAEKYYQSAMDVAMKYRNIPSITLLAMNLTRTYINSGRATAALAFLKKTEQAFPVGTFDKELGITEAYVWAYMDLGRHQACTNYCKKIAAAIDGGKLDTRQLYYACSSVVFYYLAVKDYVSAQKYVTMGKEVALRLGSNSAMADHHLFQFQIDSAHQDYISAIRHYQKFKTIMDTVYNETNSRQANQLAILHDIDKKDNNIKLLTAESGLQKRNFQQAAWLRNMSFGGLALLLITLGLLYRSYHIKKQANEKLKAQREEIDQKNQSLEKLVHEKEWLLKEIHHRVKNNLHMVVGLLNSQSEFLETEEALQAINDSQHRVQAMSLIHQKLYQTDNLSAIDMSFYIHEMVGYLQDFFGPSKTVRFQLEVDSVAFHLSHSIPIGLILNEAITNAYKYAFKDGKEALITITLSETAPHTYRLTIADNGLGLPPSFDIYNSHSLGMTLMLGLSQDIGGVFSVSGNGGTHIEINFPYIEPVIDVYRN